MHGTQHVASSGADPEIAATTDSDVVALKGRSPRLLSIDVLRGLTIAFMILVNNQWEQQAFASLKHAAWNGFTPTDLVFPTFLFLVGLSLVLSTTARLSRGVAPGTLLLHMLRRAAVLCLFGLVVNTFPFQHLDSVRFYGVLQRIGICYFAAGILCIYAPGWKSKAYVALACLIGYWVLLRYVPVPGYGVPTQSVVINHPDGNLTAYMDRMLFAPQHLYQRVRDPEGLLSTLPSIATALLGVLAGMWLRSTRTTAQKAGALVAAGVGMVLTGRLWDVWFPINKKLWTSSFVLFAGGWSVLLLGLAVFLVDWKQLGIRDVSRADAPERATVYSPLLVFGTNSIAAYMISELLPAVLAMVHTPSGNLPRSYLSLLRSVLPGYGMASLAFGLSYVCLTWLLVYPLYRKRIFLRV